jgi:hypothetical protein
VRSNPPALGMPVRFLRSSATTRKSLTPARHQPDKAGDVIRPRDAEIKQHPAPNDGKALSMLLVGKWESPRHDHLYRADGTWTMLPVEPDITHGTWRIEGNQYFDTAAIEPPQTSQYTIILISKRDFVFTDQEIVFYETRLK